MQKDSPDIDKLLRETGRAYREQLARIEHPVLSLHRESAMRRVRAALQAQTPSSRKVYQAAAVRWRAALPLGAMAMAVVVFLSLYSMPHHLPVVDLAEGDEAELAFQNVSLNFNEKDVYDEMNAADDELNVEAGSVDLGSSDLYEAESEFDNSFNVQAQDLDLGYS